ncbi:hypothetical protein PPERSA_02040 [Pseudocohnilembus persalinus]|uniref:Uncharacterized protein n=1 Tax=Pseudocohnilembus persalinus TaxID=266149 RepID=A0A0V0QF92_PSEPJ|nr:hypothetical protein PPERSA_02040 [Pseudocohnilembus persalinus]|eukprot:KRX00861.1 hypothetical protein PPERSA_02040 [Pseudocohnilembus persalinus]
MNTSQTSNSSLKIEGDKNNDIETNFTPLSQILLKNNCQKKAENQTKFRTKQEKYRSLVDIEDIEGNITQSINQMELNFATKKTPKIFKNIRKSSLLEKRKVASMSHISNNNEE